MHRIASIITLALGTALLLAGCRREQRDFTPVPPSATADNNVALSQLQPGQSKAPEPVRNPYESSAYAVSEGEMLFNAYNCSGCHFHGGGGIGPALMDDEWIYGSSPAQVYATITEGRPNGMPSFGGHIPAQQVWQLVSYVRSLSNLEPPPPVPWMTCPGFN